MKKELIIGVLITVAVVIFAIAMAVHYKNQAGKNLPNFNLTNNNQVNNINPGSQSTLSAAEVAKHDTSNDCWLIINNKVYDATNYLDQHPRPDQLIVPYCGQDVSGQFSSQEKHQSSKAINALGQLFIGQIGDQYTP
ncbi:MAG: cytochrome b5-like heme/steroid binding domain-containing protein [Patescibacteria group bacterium]